VKVTRGTFQLQFWANAVLQPALLACTLSIAAPFVLAAGSEPTPDALEQIVSSMERAQGDVQLPRQIVREYHLGSPASISADSLVIAQMDFAPPPRYVIQKHAGTMRSQFVVKSVLQHELDLSVSGRKLQAAAITHQNYDFRLLGSEAVEGNTCFLLQIIPKREQPELIRGKIWVDQQSFLIRKIDGDLAKSPSWWVKTAHVTINFSDFRGMWLQTSFDAIADVRCFGAQKLTSRVLDYTGAPLSAKNRSTPAFSVAGH
jgi:hypothetical protein